MASGKQLTEVFIRLTEIANNRKIRFNEKLSQILVEIVGCMQASRGSIMLLENKMTLEVVASTNPEIIGIKQRLEVDFPSSWVVKNKKPLYVDDSLSSTFLVRHFKHYKGDAFFLAPLISNDRVIGVVNVTDKNDRDVFNQEEREMLLNIMGNVIIALENNRLAEQLKKKQSILKKKNLELRKLEKLKTEFFNMLIHDLKGPISEIVANLDILAYTSKNDNIGFVASAQSGCNTLYNMVSNLLDIARLEEGKLPLVYEAINPKELIEESLARLLVSVKSKALKFQKQYHEADGMTLRCDRSLMTRVLQNFVTNAISFSPSMEKIKIGFQYLNSDKIEFFVEDKGPGVKKEYQEAIFDKFKQLEKKNDGREYTTGLGLAFCRMAVKAHGGSIGVESDGQSGSRFFFVVSTANR